MRNPLSRCSAFALSLAFAVTASAAAPATKAWTTATAPAATAAAAPTTAAAPATASVETEKAAYRALIDECMNKGNLAAADKYIAKDMVDHDPSNPMGGLDGFKQFVSAWRSAFPDARTEIQVMVGEGDRIMARLTAKGTHTGTFNGVPPTNRKFDIVGFDEVLFRNGKVAEHWAVADQLGLMKQLGVMPQGSSQPRPSSAPAAKPAPSGGSKF